MFKSSYIYRPHDQNTQKCGKYELEPKASDADVNIVLNAHLQNNNNYCDNLLNKFQHFLDEIKSKIAKKIDLPFGFG